MEWETRWWKVVVQLAGCCRRVSLIHANLVQHKDCQCLSSACARAARHFICPSTLCACVLQETFRVGSRLERELRGKSYASSISMSPPRSSQAYHAVVVGGGDAERERPPSRPRGTCSPRYLRHSCCPPLLSLRLLLLLLWLLLSRLLPALVVVCFVVTSSHSKTVTVCLACPRSSPIQAPLDL